MRSNCSGLGPSGPARHVRTPQRFTEEKEGETINAIVNDSEESHDVREAEPMEVSDAATRRHSRITPEMVGLSVPVG